jgi:hypothetical protein
MAETIIDGTLFNAETIRFSAPKANSAGGKSVNILNKLTNTGIRISTPLMTTWGASDFEGNQKYDMSLQFPNKDYPSEDAEAFLRNMIALEDKIKADALANSKEWFGKVHKNAEVVEALYSPMLKYPKDKATGEPDLTRAPTLKLKLPIWEGVWKCEVYDEDGQKLFPNTSNPCTTPLDLLTKGIKVATLIQCGGLWFANGKFGVTWKLIQVVVPKPKEALSGRCFIKLKPSDKVEMKATTASTEVEVEEDCVVGSTIVEDSDNEEESAVPVAVSVSVPSPSPAPAPVPVSEEATVASTVEEPKKVVKKVVKKKVATDA